VAALKTGGVDAIVVIFHQEVEQLLPLTALFRELGVSFVGSGHSHYASLTVDRGSDEAPHDDVIFCNPGPYARAFCHIKLSYDGWPPRLTTHTEEIVRIEGAVATPTHPAAPEVVEIGKQARTNASSAGDEVLARSEKGLRRSDPDQRLGHIVVDSWLDALPYAHVAITNAGGLRQDLDPGDITLRTLVGVLPFENYLLVVELTGAQLKQALAHPQTIAGGVRYSYRCAEDGTRIVERAEDLKGRRIVDDKVYKVVVNEFIYRGGDRYRLRDHDPTPEETALHWRDPVARALRELTRQGKTADPEVDGRAKAAKGQRCSTNH